MEQTILIKNHARNTFTCNISKAYGKSEQGPGSLQKLHLFSISSSFFSILVNRVPTITFQVIILGDIGVGKTSVVNQYVKKKFRPRPSQSNDTAGRIPHQGGDCGGHTCSHADLGHSRRREIQVSHHCAY